MDRSEVFEATGPTPGSYIRVKIGADKRRHDHRRRGLARVRGRRVSRSPDRPRLHVRLRLLRRCPTAASTATTWSSTSPGPTPTVRPGQRTPPSPRNGDRRDLRDSSRSIRSSSGPRTRPARERAASTDRFIRASAWPKRSKRSATATTGRRSSRARIAAAASPRDSGLTRACRSSATATVSADGTRHAGRGLDRHRRQPHGHRHAVGRDARHSRRGRHAHGRRHRRRRLHRRHRRQPRHLSRPAGPPTRPGRTSAANDPRAALLWDVDPANVTYEAGMFDAGDKRITFEELAGKARPDRRPVIGRGTSSTTRRGGGLRHARRRRRGRSGDGQGDDPALHGGPGRRDGHPSVLRRGTGARGRGAGHRLGPQRGVRLRRPTAGCGTPAFSTIACRRVRRADDRPDHGRGAQPDHPFGVRGVGEMPIVPPPAAIANAIHQAVGVRMRQLPMSPPRISERNAEVGVGD